MQCANLSISNKRQLGGNLRSRLPFSSISRPVANFISTRQDRYAPVAEALLKEIGLGDILKAEDCIDSYYLPSIALPNALGLVLKRASSRDEVWNEVVKLRIKMTPFRDYLRSLDSAHGSLREAAALLEDVLKSYGPSNLSNSVIAAAAKGAGTVSGNPQAASIASPLIGKLNPISRTRKEIDWLRRPELRITKTLISEVSSLRDNSADIARLWGAPPSRSWLEMMARQSGSDVPYSTVRRG